MVWRGARTKWCERSEGGIGEVARYMQGHEAETGSALQAMRKDWHTPVGMTLFSSTSGGADLHANAMVHRMRIPGAKSIDRINAKQ